ncbi:hypothetical protein TRVL_02417 [Trypanosoma vivax]|nr:hypothetical protein TRVL_02417 [Trypanosoma vivax]
MKSVGANSLLALATPARVTMGKDEYCPSVLWRGDAPSKWGLITGPVLLVKCCIFLLDLLALRLAWCLSVDPDPLPISGLNHFFSRELDNVAVVERAFGLCISV